MVEEMARQLSMATRRELKRVMGERYLAAGRWERRQILDEFTRVDRLSSRECAAGIASAVRATAGAAA